MKINPEVSTLLKESKIDVALGTLCLLAVYHNLDPEKICPEDIIKGINIAGIVTLDYTVKPYTVKWIVSLYEGEETDFAWVTDWAKGFSKLNPDRVVDSGACISRMKAFFARFPQYRKDDVYAARNKYFESIKETKYVKHAHKFIKEGIGKDTVSLLLSYCKTLEEGKGISYQKGKIL